MIRRDLEEVVAIDARTFGAQRWDEHQFTEYLKQRDCIGMIAEYDERVVGYMIYWLRQHKLELIRLAVHPLFRRQGIGTQMVDKLKGKLSPRRRNCLRIDLPESLLPPNDMLRACQFLRSCGMIAELKRRRLGDVYRFEHYV